MSLSSILPRRTEVLTPPSPSPLRVGVCAVWFAIACFESLAAAEEPQTRSFVGHSGPIAAVNFSPDGGLVVSGSADGSVRVWNVQSGVMAHRFSHTDEVTGAAFTTDGKTVISSSWDKTVRTWQLDPPQQSHRFDDIRSPVWGLAISSDGTRVVCGAGGERRSNGQWVAAREGNAAWVLDGAAQTMVRRFGGHTHAVKSVAISADGRRALSGSWDKTARLWSVAEGKLLHRLTGHTDEIWSVALSRDGKLAATGAIDNTARVWNA